MNDEGWREEFGRQDHPGGDEGRFEDEASSGEDAAWQEPLAGFFEQITRGDWPVRMPLTMEIYVQGSVPHIHQLRRGQRRRHPDSHIITLQLEFDRAKIREMMLEQIHAPARPGESKLPDILTLMWVDRTCFLETVVAYFVDVLAKTDAALRRDPWLNRWLAEISDHDSDLIADMVAETMRADHAAGARLRDVILDLISEPAAHDALGWLVTAAICERLQEM